MATAKLSDMMSRLGRRLPNGEAAESASDADLLARFLATRDEHAFALIVRRHGPMVLGVCRRVTGHHHLAEDAFQAVFVVLAAKAGSVRPRAALPAWLYGVAYRTALRARTMSDRRRRRESPVECLPEPAEVLPDTIEAADTIAVLDEEIARLPEHLRAAVVLCELQGCSRHDAAKHLGMAEGTLSSRLATARKALARRLHQRGLALAAAGLTAALGQVASASVPAALAEKAVAAALVPQLVPAPVAVLSNGVLRMMLAQKLKAIPVAVALVAAVVFAGGLLGSDVPAATPETPEPEFVFATAPQPAAKPARPKGSYRLFYWSKGSLRLIDPNGKNEKQVGADIERAIPAMASLSPDGKRFAGIMAVVPPGEPIPADLKASLYVRGFDEKWPGTNLGVECQLFSWSPDGTEIAFSNFQDAPNKESPDASHGIVNVKTKKVTALPIPPEHVITDWSLDGKHFLTTLINWSEDRPKGRIFLMNRDGSINKALTDPKILAFLGKLSPDGKHVLFREGKQVEGKPQMLPGLSILEVATGKVERVADVPINGEVGGFCWSPDGKRLAYAWTELHEKDSDSKETTTSLVVSDPDGGNQKTVATDTVPTGHLSITYVDWGFVVDDEKDGARSDEESIQGTWKVVSAIQDGKPVKADTRVSFTKGKMTIQSGNDAETHTFKLDPARNPKWIDVVIDEEPDLGIYELDGEKLKLCFDRKRPTEFVSKTPGSVLFVLEREKK